MSIITLRQGVDPNYNYCGLCHTCGSILEYEYSDLESPISAYHELHIICPVCGRPLAFNQNPIEEETINLSESLLHVFKDVVEVPSGVEAYTLLHQGNEIQLNKVEDFIPEETSVLILGNGPAVFRHFPGISLGKPLNMLQLAKSAIDNATGYYLNDNKGLVLRTDIPNNNWMISTGDANELTQVVEVQ